MISCSMCGIFNFKEFFRDKLRGAVVGLDFLDFILAFAFSRKKNRFIILFYLVLFSIEKARKRLEFENNII